MLPITLSMVRPLVSLGSILDFLSGIVKTEAMTAARLFIFLLSFSFYGFAPSMLALLLFDLGRVPGFYRLYRLKGQEEITDRTLLATGLPSCSGPVQCLSRKWDPPAMLTFCPFTAARILYWYGDRASFLFSFSFVRPWRIKCHNTTQRSSRWLFQKELNCPVRAISLCPPISSVWITQPFFLFFGS